MDEFSQQTSQLNISDTNMSDTDMCDIPQNSQTPFDPHEIASILSEYYQLMARMRYFSPDGIKYPPHDPPIDVELAKSLDLEPQVIELLQVLPYVEGLNNEDEFIAGGSFADFRRKRVLEQSRDPDYVCPTGDYEEENGKYVMPWMLVLNECGNHGSIMYFNTRNSHITMVWQGGAGGGCADPYFRGKTNTGEEESHEINHNRIEGFPSRPAKDLFADFTNRLMTLEWIPFNTYGPRIFDEQSKDEYPDLKLLFQTYGWPGELDSEGFDAASRRWKEFNRVRSDAQDLLKKAGQYDSEAKRLRKELEKTLGKKRNGVWDEDVARTPEGVAKMEERIRVWQQNLEWQEKLRDEAREEAEGVHDWDSALEKAWKKNISGNIAYHQRNLDWLRGDGAKYATEEKIRELEVGILELEERFQDVDALPKTAFDAIKPQPDRRWLSCRRAHNVPSLVDLMNARSFRTNIQKSQCISLTHSSFRHGWPHLPTLKTSVAAFISHQTAETNHRLSSSPLVVQFLQSRSLYPKLHIYIQLVYRTTKTDPIFHPQRASNLNIRNRSN